MTERKHGASEQNDSAQGEPTARWSTKSPHVRLVLKQIKLGKLREPEQIVEWDARHGKRLFDWDDPAAAHQWRVQQARLFFNSFRTIIDGLRVRSFIGILKDDGSGERSYATAREISANPSLRLKVIEDVTRRIAMLASELRLWKLTAKERAAILETIDERLG